MHNALAIALKPLVIAGFLLALWLFHKAIHRFIKPLIPRGRIKAFLFQPWGGIADRGYKPDPNDPNL